MMMMLMKGRCSKGSGIKIIIMKRNFVVKLVINGLFFFLLKKEEEEPRG